jgi:hypothetical protein
MVLRTEKEAAETKLQSFEDSAKRAAKEAKELLENEVDRVRDLQKLLEDVREERDSQRCVKSYLFCVCFFFCFNEDVREERDLQRCVKSHVFVFVCV